MTTDVGRSPDGSGYSAEPEPSFTVSAVPVSIPNAEMETCDQCMGAGGDNQHSVCGKCGGAGGYVSEQYLAEMDAILNGGSGS